MMIATRRYLLLILLLASLSACRSTIGIERSDVTIDTLAHGRAAIRTELYFGMSKPGGGSVSEAAWKGFLDSVITPRFPDGLTVVDARGQWRNASGQIMGEQTKVLILIHPPGDGSNAVIEEIRAEYVRRFDQESVMMLTSVVHVRF